MTSEKMIIEVEGLMKHYGEVKALDDVSFSVKEGEIFGLLGPNGAGKTTLMEILCGLRRFDEGKVNVFGLDLVKDPYKIRSLIGFCPQETLLYDLLSVRENFAFAASLYSLSSRKFKERVEFSSKFLGVEEFLNRRVQQLSGGMKRRANLAASVIHDPPIVILDEPTVGFDPNIKREFWELMKALKDHGKTLLLSTHDMYEADEICDRVAIMDEGKIVALDKPLILKKTIGGEASIRVRVKDDQVEKALKLIDKYNHIAKDNEVQVFVANPWETMPEISKKLISQRILTEKVEVVEPTLEDVFIKLTGRRLTEEYK
ncbi:MAG: ABC transporter ATP-binding protein [Candidatus Bathyarchaeota archaeon]|nr:ABC transporter ATP-binding protein [Candidatus Bathyarchaeota archaeon]MDH5787059.1 ABC transporter ATP-binding protein [Candidatus Bathyarchaeota archaeon]